MSSFVRIAKIDKLEDVDYLKLIVISDTHGKKFSDVINSWIEFHKRKDYDLFIFCGDGTVKNKSRGKGDTATQKRNLSKRRNLFDEQSKSTKLLVDEVKKLKYVKEKIVILGNHDIGGYGVGWKRNVVQEWFGDSAIVLNNSKCVLKLDTFDGKRGVKGKVLNIYGVGPYGGNSEAVWGKIPDDTNLLITHVPPRGILDHRPSEAKKIKVVSSKGLRDRVGELEKKKSLLLHVFGHIHAHGGKHVVSENNGRTVFFSSGWKGESGFHVLYLKIDKIK